MQRTLENAAQTMRVELQRLQRALADKPNARNADQTAAPTPSVKVAKEPEQMVSAEKVPYTLLAMAATLVLGLALTITRGLLATSGSVAWQRAMNNGTAGSGAVISRKGRAPGTDDDSEDAPLPVVGAASMRPPSVANLEMFAAQRSFLSMTEYAQHLIGELPVEGGYRLLMTGSHEAVDPSDEVIDLVGELSDAGLSVLLVDWSLDGERLHSDIEIGPAASLAEVMSGDVEFDDILVTLPDSNLHYVYSTDARAGGGLLNEDHLNLVLDALDEAYDYVIVAGAYDDACALFEAIQGRFDAGMTVADANVAAPAVSDDSFLGFEVADIEVVQFVRTSDRLDENRPAVEASGGNIGSRF